MGDLVSRIEFGVSVVGFGKQLGSAEDIGRVVASLSHSTSPATRKDLVPIRSREDQVPVCDIAVSRDVRGDK